MKEGQNIKVVARLRPLNSLEMQQGGECCVNYNDKQITVTGNLVYHKKLGPNDKQDFAFDRIFGPDSEQADVFEEVGRPILESVMNGYNGTIFAYGQTSSGKTFTMEGPDNPNERSKGLIPRVMTELYDIVDNKSDEVIHIVKVSFLEIYNEKIMDLLDTNKTNLKIKEDRLRGIFVQNLTEIKVESPEEMKHVMLTGSNNRTIAATRMNERSSRSHSLFQIQVSEKNLKTDSSKLSKLYFVDLAGSEKISKTNVTGQQLEEAKNINKSLTCLGMVINALTSDKKEHIPYRDSKLTRILSESLGGNAKTTLVVACSMCSYNDKETLGTLRFGARAKAIKNKPQINAEKSAKELQALLDIAEQKIIDQDEIIKQLMERVENGTPLNISIDKGGSQQNIVQAKQHSSLQLLKEHKLVVNLQEELEFQKTETAALQINYQSRMDELLEKLGKMRLNEEHIKQQLSECLKNNQKFIFDNEQLKTQMLENEQKLFDFRRAISSTKQDLSFFLANFNLKNQYNNCTNDTESMKDIFLMDQYDKDVEERTFQSILNFQEAITKLDSILTTDIQEEQIINPDQLINQLANSQNKKKNVSFRFDSQPTSPKMNKLIDIDNFSFQTEEEEMNIKFDEQTLIKSTQENEEISDVEKLLALISDKLEDPLVLYQIQEVMQRLRRQLQNEQDKVQEIYQIMISIKDQYAMYQIKEREKLQKLKLSYSQKKKEMNEVKQNLEKQMGELVCEYSKYKQDAEKQQEVLTQTNSQLVFALETTKQWQQQASQNSPIPREYQLECTVKQLMQERNEMHHSLLQTRQQLDNALKVKHQQAEEIIKLQKKIDTLELSKIQGEHSSKGDSVEMQKKAPQRLKDGVSTKLLKMIMQGTLQDQKQFQELLAQKQNALEKVQEKPIQSSMSFRKYMTQVASNKEMNRSMMISVQSLVHAPQFQKKLEYAKDKIQRYSNNNPNKQVQRQTNFTNNQSMTLEQTPLEDFSENFSPD